MTGCRKACERWAHGFRVGGAGLWIMQQRFMYVAWLTAWIRDVDSWHLLCAVAVLNFWRICSSTRCPRLKCASSRLRCPTPPLYVHLLLLSCASRAGHVPSIGEWFRGGPWQKLKFHCKSTCVLYPSKQALPLCVWTTYVSHALVYQAPADGAACSSSRPNIEATIVKFNPGTRLRLGLVLHSFAVGHYVFGTAAFILTRS